MDLSGVSFLSGFAAGVGIGLFVSRFDAACDKKQEADVPAAAGVLPIPVCFHVLPGVMGELEGAGVDFGANIGVCNDGGGGDDGSREEEFSEWCVGVKGAIRGVVKEGEGFVVLTVRRMENALYFFLCEDAKPGAVHGRFEEAVKRAQKGCEHAGCGDEAEEVYPVHVFVAVCEQLDKLRRKAGRDVEKCPGYADGGCELFVGEEFFEFSAEGENAFHGDSVTVLG